MVAHLNGLRPDISVIVKQTCVEWCDARLTEINRHVVHAEVTINTKKKKKVEKKSQDLHQAALNMYHALAGNLGRGRGHLQHGRGKGRGRRGSRGGRPNCNPAMTSCMRTHFVDSSYLLSRTKHEILEYILMVARKDIIFLVDSGATDSVIKITEFS